MSSVLVLEILLTLFLAVSPVLAKDSIRIAVSMALTCTYSQQAVSQMNAHKVRKDGVNHKGVVIVKDLGNKPSAEFVCYDNESSPEWEPSNPGSCRVGPYALWDNHLFRGGAIGREIQISHGWKHGSISEAKRYQDPVLLVYRLSHVWQANESLMISYSHHHLRGK